MNLDNNRRAALKGSAALLALGCGLLSRMLQARELRPFWPSDAFESRDLPSALDALLSAEAEPSGLIYISVQSPAINGAVVPVRLTTSLPDVRTMALLVPENPQPLALQMSIQPAVKPVLSTRLKITRSSSIVSVVETDAGIYTNSATVAVAKLGELE